MRRIKRSSTFIPILLKFIETIDDNTAKIHYNNATATNKDALLTKEQQGEKFNYVVSDLKTKKNFVILLRYKI